MNKSGSKKAFDISIFQSSLLSLATIKGFLESSLCPIKSIDRVDLRDSLGNYIVINIHSFNEEWKRFESFAKNDPRVRETVRIASPMVKRIRYWKGLSKLRSKALAHELFSREDQTLVDIRPLFGEAKAPSQVWEQILLGECAVYAIAVALTRHNVERDKAVRVVYIDGPHMIEDCGISSKSEFDVIMKKFKDGMISSEPELTKCFE